VADALGRAADGEIAVLRFGEDVHSAGRPALAYRPGKPPLALAPWSSAVAATDPVCAGDAGYHAIVVVDQSWLELGSEGLTTRDQGMTAAVRWSAEHVCVEAVEVVEAGAVQTDPPPGRASSPASRRNRVPCGWPRSKASICGKSSRASCGRRNSSRTASRDEHPGLPAAEAAMHAREQQTGNKLLLGSGQDGVRWHRARGALRGELALLNLR
jgi:hypothetical protein